MAHREVILVDSAGWVERDEQGNTHHRYAMRGEEVPESVSEEERTRLRELGAIGDPDQADDGTLAAADDDQLAGLTAEELTAYLGQHPEDAARVRAIEEGRDKPRKSVLETVDRLEQAQADRQRDGA